MSKRTLGMTTLEVAEYELDYIKEMWSLGCLNWYVAESADIEATWDWGFMLKGIQIVRGDGNDTIIIDTRNMMIKVIPTSGKTMGISFPADIKRELKYALEDEAILYFKGIGSNL